MCDTGARRLVLQQRLLSHNDAHAARNRQQFEQRGLRVVNLLSAPGSGKTSLLERLAQHWPRPPIGVVVGDLATDRDATRLQQAGARAVQIRTGDRCHLDAAVVERAVAQIDTDEMDLLVIENVGNLVCPSAFDLGEQRRVAVLAVTEGEDKPLKYPALFGSADAVLINKNDLAAVVGFDRAATRRHLQAVAPRAVVFEVSAISGEGLGAWIDWLDQPCGPDR